MSIAITDPAWRQTETETDYDTDGEPMSEQEAEAIRADLAAERAGLVELERAIAHAIAPTHCQRPELAREYADLFCGDAGPF